MINKSLILFFFSYIPATISTQITTSTATTLTDPTSTATTLNNQATTLTKLKRRTNVTRFPKQPKLKKAKKA